MNYEGLIPLGLFALGVGIFFCSYKNYDWYFLGARVPFPMGRVGARRFHMGLGMFFCLLGVFFAVVPK